MWRSCGSANAATSADCSSGSPVVEDMKANRSAIKKRRSLRPPTRKQRNFPLFVQRLNETSLTLRNCAASLMVRNLCFSGILTGLLVEYYTLLYFIVHFS